jgi:hypothetical protein
MSAASPFSSAPGVHLTTAEDFSGVDGAPVGHTGLRPHRSGHGPVAVKTRRLKRRLRVGGAYSLTQRLKDGDGFPLLGGRALRSEHLRQSESRLRLVIRRAFAEHGDRLHKLPGVGKDESKRVRQRPSLRRI